MNVSRVRAVSAVFVVAVAVLPSTAQPIARVRPLDEIAQAALHRGLSGSSLFQHLVAQLEASDLIVHVITAAGLQASAAGTTRLSSAGLQHRYVRVTIATELTPEEQTAILGHELQHACEIARSEARDTSAIRTLFQAIGRRVESSHEAYETTAAIAAGSRVWTELHQPSRRTGAKTREN
jgi:hypothetical protein